MRPIKPIHQNKTNYPDTLDSFHRVLRGNVSFDDNMQGTMVRNITSPGVANTEFAVVHNLNYIPTDFIVTKKNKASNIYASATAWTKTTAYFKADQATVILNLHIF